MKKILIALLVLTMASSAMIAGCSNKDDNNISSDNSASQKTSEASTESSSSGSTSSESEDTDSSILENLDGNEATDGDFVWQNGKYITDLSEEGAKKKEIVIPEKCQKIKVKNFATDNSFSNNKNLESITFNSEYIKDLPKGFFDSDINLKNVELPKNLKKIPEWLFIDCSTLESIEIPNSVTKIEKGAFEGTGIKELKIPESVTEVEENIFKNTRIEKLYLPESLTEISGQFLSWLDYSEPDYKLTIYVKKGSYADKHFDDYKKEITIKEYY